MDRRKFLVSTGTAAAASALPWRGAPAADVWTTYQVTTHVDVADPRGLTQAWIPLPLSIDTPWFKNIGSSWSGNALRAEIAADGKYGLTMVHAAWRGGEAKPAIEVTSRFMTREAVTDLSRPADSAERLSAADRAFYTAPTELIPTDGIVRDTAHEVTKGAKTDVEKARAIYEWVVENTYRDPKTRGCGWGDIKSMLEAKNYGGKCGDLNTMFVGLARAAGIPARDVYGVRVAPSKYGYKSLGAGSPDISKAQHCRAMFFAEGYGWVPVDPADVRKVMLEEPPGHLAIDNPKVAAARKRLFGSWEMNWLAYNMGHDVALPGSRGPRLPYLMYVNAESGGERRDQLDPASVKYKIVSQGALD
ncbi:MAG TPA: transglutaminase-like domain-containing protein [Burkholderiales bacterium]|nr:transglutaminase-like domain-containing protein [Burkholderiales bacterium]